ncbi:hypothetical protein MUK42_17996 [Musa troglodytarum]|uniref:Uncharacterized protein n=1 Tax=Musa troglodytarum TaxID=320322 RepID=A0A9E7KQ84_9LILI|nr:hypothetical protein MUK42_17996 [Musa troglodytarum]
MCRSGMESDSGVAGYPRDGDRLKIRGFYLRVSVAGGRRPFPGAITLVYLPPIDGNLLEVNGSRIRAAARAIVPLHRICSPELFRSGDTDAAVFASTDRVRAGEGVRFEAYLGEEKVVRGVFRRRGGVWGMECRCAAEGDAAAVAAVEVWVVGEKGVSMGQRVEVAAALEEERRKRLRRRSRRGFCSSLEEIPEESEGCDGMCCEGGEEEEEEAEGWESEGSVGEVRNQAGGTSLDGEVVALEMEGVRWAVDLGIWVMCLGVGLLVSAASHRRLRKNLL